MGFGNLPGRDKPKPLTTATLANLDARLAEHAAKQATMHHRCLVPAAECKWPGCHAAAIDGLLAARLRLMDARDVERLPDA